jgi:exodeoxyribonuclease VII small subunit
MSAQRSPRADESDQETLAFGDETLSFDEALVKLEELAGHLEEGDVPLEQALEVYEAAVHLFAFCRRRLDGMEQRIEQLSETLDGTLSTAPLETAGDDENG